MSKLIQKRYRIIALIILLLALGTVTYGFAASNSVPDSYAGEGSGDVLGYTVSGITYVLNSTNPNAFDRVDFTLSQSATTVRLGMDSGGAPTWLPAADCSTTNGTDFQCDLTSIGITVEQAGGLHVAAAQ